MPVCPECQPIEDNEVALRQQIDQILNDPGYVQGPTDPHPGRPDPEMAGEVRALWGQVAAAAQELDACVVQKCQGMPDLTSTLSVTSATLTIPTQPGSPFTTSGQGITLLFHKYDHRTVEITSFPAITLAPPGGATVVVTLNGGGVGTYDPAGMTLSMPMQLDFNINPNIVPSEDSYVTFDLSTANAGGSPLDTPSPNLITLASTSQTFSGGYLDGKSATLVVVGAINPHP